MNWVLTANLILLWFPVECLAVAAGLRGVYVVFEKQQTQLSLHCAVFPLLFGAGSIIWFCSDSNLQGSAWWLYVLAAVPLALGLAAVWGSFRRHKP